MDAAGFDINPVTHRVSRLLRARVVGVRDGQLSTKDEMGGETAVRVWAVVRVATLVSQRDLYRWGRGEQGTADGGGRERVSRAIRMGEDMTKAPGADLSLVLWRHGMLPLGWHAVCVAAAVLNRGLKRPRRTGWDGGSVPFRDGLYIRGFWSEAGCPAQYYLAIAWMDDSTMFASPHIRTQVMSALLDTKLGLLGLVSHARVWARPDLLPIASPRAARPALWLQIHPYIYCKMYILSELRWPA